MNNNDFVCSGDQLCHLTDDLDRYADTFANAFRPNSGDVAVIKRWLQTDFDQVVVEKLAPHFERDQGVNVMGIGTADGSMDRIMVDVLRRRFDKLRYTVVEPGSIIEEFKNTVRSDKSLSKITFDWKETTMEDYCRRGDANGHKFAFISSIHSAYYFDDLMGSLSHAMDMLAPHGALMIIANTDDNALVRLLNGLSWKKKATQARLTRNVTEFAKSRNLPLVSINLPAQINVTSCFDETSEEGSKLTDFLLEVAYFRETASADVMDETMAYMRTLATSGPDGKQYFDINCVAMIIFKN